jgi:hypothetical protein
MRPHHPEKEYNMNAKLASAKQFVVRNKATLVVAGAAFAVIALQQVGIKQHNEFLREKGLFDEFYAPED